MDNSDRRFRVKKMRNDLSLGEAVRVSRTRLSLLLILLVQAPQARNGVLTGRLVSIEGTPVAGVRVAAADASRTTVTQSASAAMLSFAQTDVDGRYRLENVPPGRYYVMAGTIDSPSYYPGTAILAEAKAISITAGTTAGSLDFPFVRFPMMQIVRAPSQISSRFFGTVKTAAGAALPNCTIMLSGPQTEDRFMTSTNQAGEFELEPMPGGQFTLEILSPVNIGYKSLGYETLKSTIGIEPRQSLQMSVRLRPVMELSAQSRPALYAPRPPRTRLTGAPRRVELSTAPMEYFLLQRVPPVYPQSAKDAKAEAIVDLQGVVGTDGRVISLRIVDPDANPDFARAAVEAVRQWRFSPRTFNGEPAEVQGAIAINFSLIK
jgi:TonB family protein